MFTISGTNLVVENRHLDFFVLLSEAQLSVISRAVSDSSCASDTTYHYIKTRVYERKRCARSNTREARKPNKDFGSKDVDACSLHSTDYFAMVGKLPSRYGAI